MDPTAPAEVSASRPAHARRDTHLGGFSVRDIAPLALIAFLAWRVIVVNGSDYFAQEGTPKGVRQALIWHGTHPRALIDLALEPLETENTMRMARLKAAAAAHPADGRLYALLALYAEANRGDELASRAMQTAIELAPQRTDVRLTAYQFWLRRNDIVRALEAANVALTREPGLAEALYPQLLKLMAHPQSDAAFGALLKQPLNWWPGFFQFLADRAPNADVLRVLYSMQLHGPNRLEEPQLRTYLSRLQRDGKWTDAYFLWLDSLPREALAFSSELHNGGFEEPTRNLGFEWIDQPVQGVLVGFDSTYGTTGSRALHVVFQGLRARWRHFGQYLILAPGDYILRGRVRIDSLQAERGVQWQIACLGASEPLATTERFKGSDQWRHFTVSFGVPESGCGVQDLRLELVGKAELDFVADGQLWFDDLAVVRK